MKTSSSEANTLLFRGKPHFKNILLADVNIPYKLSIDRQSNNLFFGINADEFSDQSFQSAVLNLNTGQTSIIPGIRNGFASAVDQATGDVYLGGSKGIFKYNYNTKDVYKQSIVSGIDIFDMYFHENLYFVDTGTQNLHYLKKKNQQCTVAKLKDNLIQHFVFDVNSDLYFVNFAGVFVLSKRSNSPRFLARNDINIRGATTDVSGKPFFVAKDGIYEIEKESEQLSKVLSLDNGHGIAFDKNNNVIYSEERSVVALVAC